MKEITHKKFKVENTRPHPKQLKKTIIVLKTDHISNLTCSGRVIFFIIGGRAMKVDTVAVQPDELDVQKKWRAKWSHSGIDGSEV